MWFEEVLAVISCRSINQKNCCHCSIDDGGEVKELNEIKRLVPLTVLGFVKFLASVNQLLKWLYVLLLEQKN